MIALYPIKGIKNNFSQLIKIQVYIVVNSERGKKEAPKVFVFCLVVHKWAFILFFFYPYIEIIILSCMGYFTRIILKIKTTLDHWFSLHHPVKHLEFPSRSILLPSLLCFRINSHEELKKGLEFSLILSLP